MRFRIDRIKLSSLVLEDEYKHESEYRFGQNRSIYLEITHKTVLLENCENIVNFLSRGYYFLNGYQRFSQFFWTNLTMWNKDLTKLRLPNSQPLQLNNLKNNNKNLKNNNKGTDVRLTLENESVVDSTVAVLLLIRVLLAIVEEGEAVGNHVDEGKHRVHYPEYLVQDSGQG